MVSESAAFDIVRRRLRAIESGDSGATELAELRAGGYDVCDWPSGSVLMGPAQVTEDYRSRSWPLGIAKCRHWRRRGYSYVGN